MGRDVQEYEEKPFGADIAAAREEPFGAGIASASDKAFGAGIVVPSELKPFSFAMRIGIGSGSSVPSTPDTPTRTLVDDERSLESHDLVQQPPSTLRSIVIILTCTLAMMHTVSRSLCPLMTCVHRVHYYDRLTTRPAFLPLSPLWAQISVYQKTDYSGSCLGILSAR